MLEKDREEHPQCLFLILLVWREGGALVSFERFYSCLFGPLEGAVCRAGCAKALSVPLLLLEMGPSRGRPGAGLVRGEAASSGAVYGGEACCFFLEG